MPVHWRCTADEFARILRERGVEPGAVHDVEAAWGGFGEFLQIEVDGIEGPGNDGDGFIVQWGRWDGNDGRPALAFGRQFAVTSAGGREDPCGQPELWQVELTLLYDDDPAWSDLDSLGHRDTGFDFAEVGASRRAALARVRELIASYPQLVALWRARPVRSHVVLSQAC